MNNLNINRDEQITVGKSGFAKCSNLNTVQFGGKGNVNIGNNAFAKCALSTFASVNDAQTINITGASAIPVNTLTTISIPGTLNWANATYSLLGSKRTFSDLSITIGKTAVAGTENKAGVLFTNAKGNVTLTIDDSALYLPEKAMTFLTAGTRSLVINAKDGIASGCYLSRVVTNCNDITVVMGDGSNNISIPAWAFFDGSTALTGLKKLVINGNLVSVAGSALKNCAGLEAIRVTGYMAGLGGDSFAGCTSLKSIDVGGNLSFTSGTAFAGCTQPLSVTVGGNVFNANLATFDESQGVTLVMGQEDGEYNLPELAFGYGKSLKSVTIKGNVNEIPANAFTGCENLVTLELSNSEDKPVTVYAGAFADCANLKSTCPVEQIVISEYGRESHTVVYDAGAPFGYYLASVEKVDSENAGVADDEVKTVAVAEGAAFTSVPKYQLLVNDYKLQLAKPNGDHVSSDKIKSVRFTRFVSEDIKIPGWSMAQGLDMGFFSLAKEPVTQMTGEKELYSNDHGDKIAITLNDVSITKEGSYFAIVYRNENAVPDDGLFTYEMKKNATTNKNELTITGYAGGFKDNYQDYTLAIPDKANIAGEEYPVTAIAMRALENPPAEVTINKITFNNNIEGNDTDAHALSIGSYALSGLTAVNEIDFNGMSPVYLDSSAFAGTGNTESGVAINMASAASMPNRITTSVAFAKLAAPYDLAVSADTSIDENTFKEDTKLHSITVNSLSSIGKNAFAGCTNLENINLGTDGKNGGKALTVYASAFTWCKNLDSLCKAEQTVISDDSTVVFAASETGVPFGAKVKVEKVDEPAGMTDKIRNDAKTAEAFAEVAPSRITANYYKLIAENADDKLFDKSVTVKELSFSRGYSEFSEAEVYNAVGLLYRCDTTDPARLEKWSTENDAENYRNSFDLSDFTIAAGGTTIAAAYSESAEIKGKMFTYTIDKDENVTITGYGPEFTGNTIEIPTDSEVIDGVSHPVVAVAKDAFKTHPENIGIEKITINNTGNLAIASGAFSDLTGVKTIEFKGTGAVTCADDAFEGSGADSGVAVSLANGQPMPGKDAKGAPFAKLNAAYDLTISGVETLSIEEGAFSGDSGLRSLTVLNGSLTSIGKNAFNNCSGLKTINLGTDGNNGGVELTVNAPAFNGCTSLESTCPVKQTVTSSGGTVVFEARKPYGMYLESEKVNAPANLSDDAVKTAATAEDAEFAGIPKIKLYVNDYKLTLKGTDGNSVAEDVSSVSITRYTTELDTPNKKINKLGFYVWNGSAVEEKKGVISSPADMQYSLTMNDVSIAKDGSIFAMVYKSNMDAELDGGMFRYTISDDGKAVIVGYGSEFAAKYSNNTLAIPAQSEEIEGETYPVAAVAENALNTPPENVTIKKIVFQNTDPLTIGSRAFSELKDVTEIDFNGTGLINCEDSLAFNKTGAEGSSVAVNFAHGLTAPKSPDFGNGAKWIFAKLNRPYDLTINSNAAVDIPNSEFRINDNLQSVTINAPTASFSESAFDGCSNLTSVTINAQTVSFGDSAFSACSNLASVNTGNAKVTSIGEYAFNNTGLSAVTMKTQDTVISEYAFNNCNALKTVEFDGTVAGIEQRAFGYYNSKPESLVFTGKVGTVAKEAVPLDQLKYVLFKDGVDSVKANAFYSYGLTEPKPETDMLVVYVGAGNDNPSLPADAFSSRDNIKVYLNLDKTRAEASASRNLWKDKTNVEAIYAKEEMSTLSDIYVDFDNGSDESGLGTFGGPFKTLERAHKYAAGDEELDRWEYFKGFLDKAGADSDGLGHGTDKYKAPETFTLHILSGGNLSDEFKGESGLTGLMIEADEGTVAIADGAFEGCENLAKVETSDPNYRSACSYEFGAGAFKDCTALESLLIKGYGDFSIGENAFENCSALASVEAKMALSAQNGTVEANAFKNCGALESVELQSVPNLTIKDSAFKDLKKLGMLDIIQCRNVNIGISAFEGCENLSEVRVYMAETADFEGNSFANCGEIEKLIVVSTEPAQIAAKAFAGDRVKLIYFGSGDSKVNKAAFEADDIHSYYVDGSRTFDGPVIKNIGKAEYVILTRPESIKAGAGVFSGNDALKGVYLSKDTSPDGIAGNIFDGLPEKAGAFIALKQENLTAEQMPVRENGAIHYLDLIGSDLYVDGTKDASVAHNGTKEDPFASYEQCLAYAKDHKGDYTEDASAGGERYYSDIQKAVSEALSGSGIVYAKKDVRFPRSADGTNYLRFLVIGTLTVSENSTWDNKDLDGLKITLEREDEFTKDPMLVVQSGTLTLSNVALDGGDLSAETPLVKVNAGAALNVNEGAEICGNRNTKESYPYNGGGIYSQGDVTVDRGEVYDNYARVNGGGILMNGCTLIVKNEGKVRDNVVDSGAHSDGGGGIALMGGATMKLQSGGEVTGNKARGNSVGGGIMVGSHFSDDHSNINVGHFEMTGCKVNNNSAGREGGGIYISCDSDAAITSGEIKNNTSGGGEFGGGGIYVNGARYGKGTGRLYVNNVVIRDNDAGTDGDGIAACETAKTSIFMGNGGAIFDNGNEDVFLFMRMTGNGSKAVLAPRMVNGAAYNWKYADGTPVRDEDLSYMTASSNHLRLKTSPDTKEGNYSVEISGNKASTRGGGIGSNGFVQIGDAPEPNEVTWTPELEKLVKGRDMREGETLKFNLYKENMVIEEQLGGVAHTYSYKEDELIDTAVLTDAKEGEPAKVVFNTIELGQKGAADIGEAGVGYYLAIEVEPEGIDSSNILLPEGRYLAFRVMIGQRWNETAKKMEYFAYTHSVEEGKYEMKEGKPDFNIEKQFGYEFMPRYRRRIEKAQFTNYLLDCDIEADKTWLKHSGSERLEALPNGTKVTLQLLADGAPAKHLGGASAENIELTGTKYDDSTRLDREADAWKALWQKLPVYRSGQDGKLIEGKDGYEKIEYTVKEVSVQLADYSKMTYALAGNDTKPAASNVPTEFINRLYNLPNTGGTGTAVFYITGAGLLSLAVMIFILRRKKNINSTSTL